MKQFLVCFILLLLLSICPQSALHASDSLLTFKIDRIETEVPLSKFWKYHQGDDSLWKQTDFDDSRWDTVHPNLDLSVIDKDIFSGNAWFRLHIKIDSSLRNSVYALNLDQQGASEVYLNGKRIGKFGIIQTLEKEEKTRNPKFIPFLIEFDDNTNYVLAIRYSNVEAEKNLKRYDVKKAGFSLVISPSKSAIRQLATIGYMRNIISIFFAIFLTIAFVHLLLFLFYQKQKSNLYFFLFMTAISMIWVIILIQFPLFAIPSNINKIHYYAGPFIAISFSLLSIFIYSIFYSKFPKIIRVLLVLIPIIIFLGLLPLPWTGKVVSGINIIIMIDIIRNIIRAIIKKIEGAWIIGSGFIMFIFFFLIVAIIGLTSGTATFSNPGNPIALALAAVFFIGFFSILLSMSIYLARDFARTNLNLSKQLENVKILSEKTIEQEKEKQKILENQKEKLEIMVDERTAELALEKEKTEELLLNTLPLKVVNELKENGHSEPESFEDVTVYFSDIVGFTKISSTLEPNVLIKELNEIFTEFDDIIERNYCERIKTIGDAYLAVSGMPIKNEKHAENMIKAAIEIKNYLLKRNRGSEIQWQARIGIHSGKVVGGIVGVRKYIYDVFGDTINTASRMESNSEPMRINVSETTYSILKDTYSFIKREPINVKGKGSMNMYFLDA